MMLLSVVGVAAFAGKPADRPTENPPHFRMAGSLMPTVFNVHWNALSSSLSSPVRVFPVRCRPHVVHPGYCCCFAAAVSGLFPERQHADFPSEGAFLRPFVGQTLRPRASPRLPQPLIFASNP